MPLPSLLPTGVLPAGRYDASLAEVRSEFVSYAPSHKATREELWSAFELWQVAAHRHFGAGEVWMSGTMMSQTSLPPTLRIVMFPRTPSMARRAIDRGEVGLSLLTLEDIIYSVPNPGGHIKSIRPMGALLDASIGDHGEAHAWDLLMSLGEIDRSGTFQHGVGYVSVRI